MSLRSNHHKALSLLVFGIACLITAAITKNFPTALTAGSHSHPAIAAPFAGFVVNQTTDSGDLTCDATCTLRDAIDDANATAGADTITFDPAVFNTPRTIVLTGTVLTISDSVTITGPGANLLTVSGNNAVRVFVISAGDTASISDMTITQGNSLTGSAPGFGGGIYNLGTLTVTNVVVTNNKATIDGGGIYNSTSDTLTVINSTISNNIADSDNASTGSGGGGIYSNTGGNLTITNSTISGNSIGANASSGGGGVASFGPATITGSTISGNSSGLDGGGIFSSSTLTATNLVVTNNQAFRTGGGIFNSVNDTLNVTNCTIANNVADSDNSGGTATAGGLQNSTGGTMTVTNSTISGNSIGAMIQSGGGGGVGTSGVTTIINSTISGNSSGLDGGGIFSTQGSGALLTVTNSTVVNNTAQRLGGGFFQTSLKSATVGNTIIANNADGGLGTDFGGPLNSLGYNLIESTTGTTISGTTTGNLTGLDPKLGPLQNNGGATHTHALLSGSPVVDKGASGTLLTDQRELTRPFDDPATPNATGGNGADIGAFEAQQPLPPLPTQLELSHITPNKGGDQGVVSPTVYGMNIQSGATIKLARNGQADINGETPTVSADGSSIQATFNLIGKAHGAWNVVVSNPDNSTATLPGAFTVEANTDPSLWVRISGRNTIRASQFATSYTITYGNNGNVDAFSVPLFVVGIPSSAQVKLLFPLASIPDVLDPALSPVFDYQGQKMIPLVVRRIPAGSVTSLKFTIRFSSISADDVMRLRAVISGPMLKPVLQSASSATPKRLKVGQAHHAARRSPTSVTLGEGGSYQFVLTPECANSMFQSGLTCLSVATGLVAATQAQACAAGFIGFFSGLAQTFANGQPNVWDLAQVTIGALNTIPSCAAAATGLTPFGLVVGGIQCVLSVASAIDTCFQWVDDLDVRRVQSYDPNAKVGPRGKGDQNYISSSQPVPYSIFFENLPTASAPAQTVVVTDQLDPTKLDLSTFSLGQIGWGEKVVTPPQGLQSYDTDIDLRPDKDLIVRIHAALDVGTGIVAWQFQSIDPDTNQPTTDPLAGFLPPNLDGLLGQGNVLFNVMPKSGLAAGTVINNQARIIFDLNAPIDTNTFSNIIDDSKPTSQVTALAASQCGSFNVSWSGTDTGAGIDTYTIFVSDNGGPFTEWHFNTDATSASFVGTAGHTYGFYSVAHDGAGNSEAGPPNADAVTNVSATCPTAQFGAASYSGTEGPTSLNGLGAGQVPDGIAISASAGVGTVVVQINRSGDTSQPAAVDYATQPDTADDRSDYTGVFGTLRFAAGEQSKSILVLITDDSFQEPVESFSIVLSNPVGMNLGTPASVTVQIASDDTPTGLNPVADGSFNSEKFVRFHYADMLNRLPDPGGLGFWKNEIDSCETLPEPQRQGCREVKRINVSAAFFLSIEFQQTGYLVYRLHTTAFQTGEKLAMARFLADTQEIGNGVIVGQANWEQLLEASKQGFLDRFVTRQAFLALYPASMTPAAFVDALNANSGNALSQTERDTQVANLTAAGNTAHARSLVLRAIAEDADFVAQQLNRAFVYMQYVGYLRRAPNAQPDTDFSGFNFWLNKLNQFNGNFVNAEMVKAFILSGEYQQRFGP